VPRPKRLTGIWVGLADLHVGIAESNRFRLPTLGGQDDEFLLPVARLARTDSTGAIYFSRLSRWHYLPRCVRAIFFALSESWPKWKSFLLEAV